MEEERTTISISKNIYDKIFTRIKNPQTGFGSVEEYVDYVLKEVLDELSENSQPEISKDKKSKIIKDKLEKLGYI